MDNQPQSQPEQAPAPGEAGAGGFYLPPGSYPGYTQPPRSKSPLPWIIGGCGCLIVLAILGIVASIAIPILLSARVGALNEKARNALRSVVSAEAAYYAANARYGSLRELTTGPAPYLDGSFQEGADLGQGLVLHVTAQDGSYAASVTVKDGRPPYHTFTADEGGMIAEH
jgi:hypothetical protein